jgi:hypothetical protein
MRVEPGVRAADLGEPLKMIVRFGRGSFLGDSLRYAADFERQRAPGVVVVGTLFDDAFMRWPPIATSCCAAVTGISACTISDRVGTCTLSSAPDRHLLSGPEQPLQLDMCSATPPRRTCRVARGDGGGTI